MGAPIVEAPQEERRDDFVLKYMKDAEADLATRLCPANEDRFYPSWPSLAEGLQPAYGKEEAPSIQARNAPVSGSSPIGNKLRFQAHSWIGKC